MAYTKIKPVRNNLNRCLNYTSNPDKTEVFLPEDVNRVLAYAQDGDKTEHQLYVAGFNCDPATAFSTMQATKRRWGKSENSGVLAYHIIQSFRPQEVTPELCFEIGCEFARRFLAERYECTVSTHLDRQHLHCHIVFNSVSFTDGRMFRNDFANYYRGIRAVSDELCREHNLSVIETDGHGQSYEDWKRSKQGDPTLRSFVQRDADRALLTATSYEGFLNELKNMGYQVNASPTRKYTTVIAPGRSRGVRLEKLDPKYAETAVREQYRQLHSLPKEMREEYRRQAEECAPYEAMAPPRIVRMRCRRPISSYKRRKCTGFMALYYRYCSLLRRGKSGHSSQRCHYLLREDFLKFDRYVRQCKFLWQNHIETTDDLERTACAVEREMQQLTRERKQLYKQKGRETDENVKAAMTQRIEQKTTRLKELRREAELCRSIREDAAAVEARLAQADALRQEERENEVNDHEQRRRSR